MTARWSVAADARSELGGVAMLTTDIDSMWQDAERSDNGDGYGIANDHGGGYGNDERDGDGYGYGYGYGNGYGNGYGTSLGDGHSTRRDDVFEYGTSAVPLWIDGRSNAYKNN